MTGRLNYGPRFRSSAVSVGAHYDPTLDFRAPWFVNHAEAGSKKAVLRAAKASTAARAKRAKDALAGPSEYEIAEQRLIGRIREVVKILEMGLEELNSAQGQPATKLSRKTVHDLVFAMKHKLNVVI